MARAANGLIHARRALAMTLQARGQYATAINADQDALQFESNHADCWLNIGIRQQEQGALVVGETAIRRALDIDAMSSVNWSSFATNLVLQERHTEALQAFERAEAVASAKVTDCLQLC